MARTQITVFISNADKFIAKLQINKTMDGTIYSSSVHPLKKAVELPTFRWFPSHIGRDVHVGELQCFDYSHKSAEQHDSTLNNEEKNIHDSLHEDHSCTTQHNSHAQSAICYLQ